MTSGPREAVVKHLDAPDDTISFDNGTLEVVTLGDVTIKRATVDPGWTWSEDVAPLMGTDRCESHHTLYVVSGRLRIEMNDGTESEGGPGDVMGIPPGHDSWVAGDDPLVYVDFGVDPQVQGGA